MSVVADWLAQRAHTRARRCALRFDRHEISFAELGRGAADVDARLSGLGLGSGDRIAVLVGSRPGLVELVHGIPRRGRVMVPLGTRLGGAEVGRLLASSGARLVIYENATREVVAAARGGEGPTGICIDDDPLRGDSALRDLAPAPILEAPAIELDSVHSIVFTSGSSGAAKGVYLTWNNHLWSALGSAFNLGVHDHDCWLACMPLHHVGGASILLRGAIYGMPVELHPSFDPHRVNRAIDARRVTIVSFVANMLQRVLEDRDFAPFPDTLRCILLGGGPLPHALSQCCRDLRVPLAPTYGMTETASQIATAAPGADVPAGSVGRPLIGAELRIVDTRGEACAPTDTGRIQVRGPVVSPGYLDEPTRSTTSWFDTGDLGSLDESGDLYVLGRADDTVISGGENIHPSEIERVLEAHPAVLETCAFGIADERWGQSLHACVRLRAGAQIAERHLRAHCAEKLARFKVPQRVHVVDDFPRTPAGKIARRSVADRYGSGA
jgi:O-succinylbenzoic acid--CoA ligase